jgi:hypothetical protein
MAPTTSMPARRDASIESRALTSFRWETWPQERARPLLEATVQQRLRNSLNRGIKRD